MSRIAARVGLFAVLFGASAGPSSALDPALAPTQYGRHSWTTEQGLPQNSVHAIVQTRDGHLWLGTQEGLVRFDGVRFVVFDEKTSAAFKHRHVISLHEDRAGTLWIGTRGGGLLRYRDGSFAGFDSSSGLPSDIVRCIYEDRSGRLWVGTDGGVVRLEGDRFIAPPGVNTPPFPVMAIEEAEGAIWLGTDGGGLLRIADGVERYTRKRGLSSDEVRALRAGHDGALWIGSRAGLDCWKGGRLAHPPPPAAAWEAIGAIAEDRGGNLWVGTRGQGLARLTNGQWRTFGSKEGLTSDLIWSLLEDREGSLWIGTDGGGLNHLHDVKVVSFGKPEGLTHDMLMPITEDRLGNTWMGSYGGGLHRFHNGQFRAFTTRDGLSSNLVASLLEDHTGALWVGTDGGGLNLFRNGAFTVYRTRDGLPSDRVIGLAADRAGGLWIGTYGGGVARLREGKFTLFGRALGLSSDLVLSLAIDSAGRLWAGTDGSGLNVLENGRFRAYTTEQGLAHNRISCISQDAAGSLWIGTLGGLSVLRQGKLSTVTRRDGLAQDRIFQVLEDDQGRLWMSGNKGIFYVSKRELEDFADGRVRSVVSVSFDSSDGMRSSECNGDGQPAGWKARDGSLWFPTVKGVVRVDPARIPMNTLPPPVSIEEVVIDRRPYDPRGPAAAPAGRGEIEIKYAGLSFVVPEKVRFKYRLEGFDQGWVDPGTRRVAYYTNIPPGAYRFRVLAANNDGVWNEEGASFAFELRPHLYQAAWFRVLAALAVVGIAFAVHRVRVRHLAVREKRLATLVADRTHALQDAERRLALLADVQEKAQMIAFVQDALARPSQGPSSLLSPPTSPFLSQGVEPRARRFEVGMVVAGRYELQEEIGQGGMGVVYRAYDRELDEPVAVKFLAPELLTNGRHSVDRFKQETRVARRVSHPNIVRTHDFGEADGTPFISMEYVAGVTLKALLARAPVPLGVGLRIAKQLCQGLDAAHREGIVHRDVKPNNVLILPDKGELKIMDFGIARATQIHAPGTTLAGTILGTPAYLSPEQALGKPADQRSDIYSVGVVLYEMFLGRLPFSGGTAMEVLLRHLDTPPPPPRSLSPTFPAGLEAVILRCLGKDPAERYQSISDILVELTTHSTSHDAPS